jgi:hypothetical protein
MAMKHCTQFQISLISHKGREVKINYFILSSPLGSTITQREGIESSCPKIYTCTNDNDLFVCLFVYSHTSNFSAIRRLSPLPVTGLQILAYAWHSGPSSRERSLPCHTYCDTGPQFIRFHPKDRHLRTTVVFEPSTQESSDFCTRRS